MLYTLDVFKDTLDVLLIVMNQTLKESEKVASPTQTSLGASPTETSKGTSPTETSMGSSERPSKRDTPDTLEMLSPEKKSLKGSGDSVDGQSQKWWSW